MSFAATRRFLFQVHMWIGFVPTLFVVAGVVMWLKKRRRHIPMPAALAEEVVG